MTGKGDQVIFRMKKAVLFILVLMMVCFGLQIEAMAGTMTSSSVGEPIELEFKESKENTISTDSGVLVIKGYAINPMGFVDFTDNKQYGDQSIFTVHATMTVKADSPKSVWGSYNVQIYQKGIEVWSYCDTNKKVNLMTKLLPGTPVDLDIDFLVESDTAPVTFVVTTWGHPKEVFRKQIDLTARKPKEQTKADLPEEEKQETVTAVQETPYSGEQKSLETGVLTIGQKNVPIEISLSDSSDDLQGQQPVEQGSAAEGGAAPQQSEASSEDKRFEKPTIKIYEYYESDEPVEISSAWPEGADSLAIYVRDDQGNDAIPGCIWDKQNKGWTFYTFEVNVQDRRLEPGSYTAVIEVRGEGYRTRRYKRPFLILPEGVTLDDYEASLAAEVQVTPTPEAKAPETPMENASGMMIHVPLELDFPDSLDDPQMQQLIAQGIVAEKDSMSLQPPQKQAKLFLNQCEFQVYYNRETRERTKKFDIRLRSTDYRSGDIIVDGQYNKDQKLVAFTLSQSITDGDTSVEMHDRYHPDGSCYFERIITTAEQEYYYFFSDHQLNIHRGSLSFTFDIPEKEWILYTAKDTELDSVVKDPDFEYKYKLADVTLEGKLDFFNQQIVTDQSSRIDLLTSTGKALSQPTSAPADTPSPVPTSAPTDTPEPEPVKSGKTLEFRRGSQLILFDQDGMRLTLTGEVEDKGGLNIELAARFENKTGKDLNLIAEGSVNGTKMTPTFVKKSNTESGKTSDCAIQINYNDFDLSRYTDIRQMQLSFKVQEIKTEVSSSSSSSSSSSGKNSHASASASASSSVTSVVGVYKNIGQVDIRFADHVEIEGDRYFEEQPALAHPSNYVSVRVTGSSTSSSNGKMNSATYTFAPKDSGKKAADLLKTYLDELKKQGLTVTGSGGEYVVSNNGIPIARIALDGGNFVVTLIP